MYWHLSLNTDSKITDTLKPVATDINKFWNSIAMLHWYKTLWLVKIVTGLGAANQSTLLKHSIAMLP